MTYGTLHVLEPNEMHSVFGNGVRPALLYLSVM